MTPGSYHNGFAPRDGLPRYPSLWQGCVGAWHPGLGPSGTKLYDAARCNNGTLTGMAPASDWVVTQKGYVLDFDGTDDHVDCGNPSCLQITGALTLACWIRIHDTTEHSIMTKDKDTGGRAYTLDYFSSNSWRFYINGGGTPGTNQVNSGASTSLNTWYHVCATFKPSSFLKIYQNGALQNTASTSVPGSIPTATANVHLGDREYTGFRDYMNGQMTDARIYNRVLDESEIMLLSRYPGIAYELAEEDVGYVEPAAPGGLSIPIAAYHYNHHLGTMG